MAKKITVRVAVVDDCREVKAFCFELLKLNKNEWLNLFVELTRLLGKK